jgi:hypothetical protein
LPAKLTDLTIKIASKVIVLIAKACYIIFGGRLDSSCLCWLRSILTQICHQLTMNQMVIQLYDLAYSRVYDTLFVKHLRDDTTMISIWTSYIELHSANAIVSQRSRYIPLS